MPPVTGHADTTKSQLGRNRATFLPVDSPLPLLALGSVTRLLVYSRHAHRAGGVCQRSPTTVRASTPDEHSEIPRKHPLNKAPRLRLSSPCVSPGTVRAVRPGRWRRRSCASHLGTGVCVVQEAVTATRPPSGPLLRSLATSPTFQEHLPLAHPLSPFFTLVTKITSPHSRFSYSYGRDAFCIS